MYEKLTLVTASLSNTIYLTEEPKNGVMSDKRKDMTETALIAVATHLMGKKDNEVTFKGFGKLVWIPEENKEN